MLQRPRWGDLILRLTDKTLTRLLCVEEAHLFIADGTLID